MEQNSNTQFRVIANFYMMVKGGEYRKVGTLYLVAYYDYDYAVNQRLSFEKYSCTIVNNVRESLINYHSGQNIAVAYDVQPERRM